mgnify:CR=1 FL=1
MKLLAILLLSIALSAQQKILLLKTSGKAVFGDTTIITTPRNYNLYIQNGIPTERVKVALKSEEDWSEISYESHIKKLVKYNCFGCHRGVYSKANLNKKEDISKPNLNL